MIKALQKVSGYKSLKERVDQLSSMMNNLYNIEVFDDVTVQSSKFEYSANRVQLNLNTSQVDAFFREGLMSELNRKLEEAKNEVQSSNAEINDSLQAMEDQIEDLETRVNNLENGATMDRVSDFGTWGYTVEWQITGELINGGSSVRLFATARVKELWGDFTPTFYTSDVSTYLQRTDGTGYSPKAFTAAAVPIGTIYTEQSTVDTLTWDSGWSLNIYSFPIIGGVILNDT